MKKSVRIIIDLQRKKSVRIIIDLLWKKSVWIIIDLQWKNQRIINQWASLLINNEKNQWES